MRRNILQKELVVNRLRDKLLQCEGVILTEYLGLRVQDMDILRSKCRENGVEYRVVKNTLTKLAIRDTQLSELSRYLVGPTAIGISHQDPIAAAKIMVGFAKEYPVFKIKAGVLNGRVFGPDEVEELASLPQREVLIAQVLAMMRSPILGLINALSAPIIRLINLLKTIEQEKAKYNGGEG